MEFKGAALPLSDGDVEIVAGYLGCDVAAVRAVLKIESAGHGFSAGRPLILNEPHWFYRLLSGSQRTRAVNEGLAYSKWGSRPYPKTQAARYAWLDRAMAINGSAALQACSWGLGQIMGFNYRTCGFASVEEFVEAMKASEGAQLFAVARFCVSKGLQKHLRSKSWSSFAYGYNGAAYAKNGYHTKLAAAYNSRPSSERRTPPPPTQAELDKLKQGGSSIFLPSDPKPPPPEDEPETTPPTWSRNRGIYLKQGARGARVEELIEDLHALGFYSGSMDDLFGPATYAAVRAFQKAKGLRMDGIAGPVTLDAIDVAMQERATTKKAETATASGAGVGAIAIGGTMLAGFDPWVSVGVGVVMAALIVVWWVFRKD